MDGDDDQRYQHRSGGVAWAPIARILFSVAQPDVYGCLGFFSFLGEGVPNFVLMLKHSLLRTVSELLKVDNFIETSLKERLLVTTSTLVSKSCLFCMCFLYT